MSSKNGRAAWLAEVRRRVAAKVCRVCQVPLKDERRKCPECRAVEAAQRDVKRKQWIAAGRCSRCGKKAKAGQQMCDTHYRAALVYYRNYYARKRSKAARDAAKGTGK